MITKEKKLYNKEKEQKRESEREKTNRNEEKDRVWKIYHLKKAIDFALTK